MTPAGMDLDKLKSIAEADVQGKRVLVRADLNVPVKDGKVTDATRLERMLPGLKDLERARRPRRRDLALRPPQGRARPELEPCARSPPSSASCSASRCSSCPTASARPPRARSRALAPGEIAVLENLRFHKGEEKNDPRVRRGARRAPATSSSTMPSRPRTARTPRPRA